MKIAIHVNTEEHSAVDVHAMVDRIFGEAPSEAAKTPAKKAPAKKAAEKSEPEAEPEVDKSGGFTRADVKAKLKEYAALEGKDAAIGILKDNGAASIGELEEEKFAAVIEACD